MLVGHGEALEVEPMPRADGGSPLAVSRTHDVIEHDGGTVELKPVEHDRGFAVPWDDE